MSLLSRNTMSIIILVSITILYISCKLYICNSDQNNSDTEPKIDYAHQFFVI